MQHVPLVVIRSVRSKNVDCSVLEIPRFKSETGLILIDARKANIPLSNIKYFKSQPWTARTSSKPSRRSITAAKDKKKEKGKAKKKMKNYDFCACSSKNVVKRGASGKKGMLSCWKCFLSRPELIWSISDIQPENVHNVQNGLKHMCVINFKQDPVLIFTCQPQIIR